MLRVKDYNLLISEIQNINKDWIVLHNMKVTDKDNTILNKIWNKIRIKKINYDLKISIHLSKDSYPMVEIGYNDFSGLRSELEKITTVEKYKLWKVVVAFTSLD